MISKNTRYIIYALSHSFASSYGQTIFLSLFVPYIQKEYSLLDLEFGRLYAIATFTSALILPFPGRLIDTTSLRYYSFVVLCGLCISVCVALLPSLIGLFLGIIGIRLFSQSLMSHISSTSISRMFSHERGRALSLAGLGHSLGESLLPMILLFLMNSLLLDWKVAWFAMLIPLFFYMSWVILGGLLKKDDIFFDPIRLYKKNQKERNLNLSFYGMTGHHWKRKIVLKNNFFYWIIPLWLSSPFLLTGFLFYQVKLVEYKGWDLQTFVFGLGLFALFRIFASILTGFLIDRFTSFQIFIYSLLPLNLAVLFLYFSSHQIFSFVFLTCLGFSAGVNMHMKSSLLSEVYGTKFLGSIKSLYSMLIVLSTGAATWLFGLLLTYKITFDQIALGAFFFLLIATFFAWIAKWKMTLLVRKKLVRRKLA